MKSSLLFAASLTATAGAIRQPSLKAKMVLSRGGAAAETSMAAAGAAWFVARCTPSALVAGASLSSLMGVKAMKAVPGECCKAAGRGLEA